MAEIPDAAGEVLEAAPRANPEDVPPELLLGPPFAMSMECRLIEKGGGCKAVVECECGQVFRMDLLTADIKVCPKCRNEYTHVLVVTTNADREMAGDMFTQILAANGYANGGGGGGDDGDEDNEDDGDEDGDEDDGDEDGDEDDEDDGDERQEG